MAWSADAPQGLESDKIAHLVVPYVRGQGLDVGCGTRKCWPHMIGVDHGKDHWGRGDADILTDACSLVMFADASLNFVFSSHNLEHVVDYKAALKEWWRVLKPGGHLVLYLPHKDLYPNIGQFGANEDHKHDFHPDDIIAAMREIGPWTLVENEDRNGDNEYSFFQVYRKEAAGDCVVKVWERNPGGKKRCLVIRYGAIGDILQAASVFPHLKAQGFHVTVNTTPDVGSYIEHDPNVDELLLQNRDQVPNAVLGPYWLSLEERYDRIVNLCESVEGGLLQLPGRLTHKYSHEARHRIFNINYVERMHDIAAVPYEFHQRFYPTVEERAGAREARRKMRGPVVMWSVSGSSHHKVYPFTQIVVKWLLDRTNATVVLVSDPFIGKALQDAIIEAVGKAGGDTARILGRAGMWQVRQSLTFNEFADVVVGPETGILNGAAQLPVPKVIFLSHSSPENLTKHWKNTQSLQPVKTPCWPCHTMHYDWTFCHKVEDTAAALCASNISPERVFQAIVAKLPAQGGVR